MKSLLFATSAMFASAVWCPAAVTLGFDSDVEGFIIQAGATAMTQSVVNGGSLQIDASGGWAGNSAQLSIQSNGPLWAELQDALANGGTLSFDIVVQQADQDFTITTPTIDYPDWFEVVLIGNSSTENGIGGWDQEVLAFGLGEAQWPLAGGSLSHTFSLPITGDAFTADNDILSFDTTPGWSNLHLGINNDGGALSNATVHFDNIAITANAIPEPSGFALIGLAALGLGLRRRR